MVFRFFDKKTCSGASVNEELAEALHKPVIEKFQWGKVYSRFSGNIWAADLAEIRSSSSLYQHVKYLLCEIDVFTKYPSVKL